MATAPLILALASAELFEELDAVLSSTIEREAAETVLLLRQLRKLDHPRTPLIHVIARRLVYNTVRARDAHHLVDLVVALEASELSVHSHGFISAATSLHGSTFTDKLKKTRGKHQQKILSRAFWQKTPATRL
ncbi:hypothetical protein [Streptomyces sp. NBC_01429]|uniref:hypothetical protein n=1 Tax=Streptomyces sp. NBC_01429 TaxID=2903862 RepID=UPI002E2C1969|nr:hypothetical protein [Streptomyces sp. NBC_01429]